MSSVIVFDLDDTLYLEQDYVKSGFIAVDRFLSTKNVLGFFDLAWQYFSSGGRGDTFNIVLSELSVPFDDSFIKELVSIYREHNPSISLCPDALAILEKLYSNNSLGMITDGFSVTQHNKIQALNLTKYFKKIVVTDDLQENREYWKPHQKAYDLIQEFFDVKHESCLYIGDNETKDFVTAKKLNWKTVCIERPEKVHQHKSSDDAYKADVYLRSLDELEAIL